MATASSYSLSVKDNKNQNVNGLTLSFHETITRGGSNPAETCTLRRICIKTHSNTQPRVAKLPGLTQRRPEINPSKNMLNNF